eukprot:GHRQ01027685.1.p2 GENE.GHRQ01027685.1~~GHRQ01027685.1.p2  ORF type:complete len:103 (+),score=24.27 GHRQ01027685.1:251-559(+)
MTAATSGRSHNGAYHILSASTVNSCPIGMYAGCVPIYRGSPNVLDIMPEPQAVILYGPGGNASTVQQLDALLADISADRSRYEAMLAWKHKPVRACCAGLDC